MEDLTKSIKVTFNKDYLRFKAGDSYEIPTQWPLGITYVTGQNGSGKSTLLRAIRCSNDSLADINIRDFDGLVDNRLDKMTKLIKAGNVTIESEIQYTHIFSIDAQADDPQNVLLAASAGAFVGGGGFHASRMSRGEAVLVQFMKFVRRFQEARLKATELKQSFRPLVIIDEIDEGIDIRFQTLWNELILTKFLAPVICCTHSPICMLSNCSLPVNVYDMSIKEASSASEYFARLTGVKIDMDYTNAKTAQEMLNEMRS
jgi:predicted ATPase